MAPQSKASHKQERLRHNAMRALEEALAAEGDPVFDGLVIREVVPGRGNAFIAIVAGAEDAAHQKEAQEAFDTGAGWLRAEVAATLQRRRVPDLTFVVLAPGVADYRP
jgi:ribosome-binding factor A